MTKIEAFVGHSFEGCDAEVVRKFLDFFGTVQDMGIGFSWNHAEVAEPKVLNQKIKDKMQDRNTFIGICTKREHAFKPTAMRSCRFARGMVKVSESSLESKTSDWLLQEIGFAVSRDMQIVLLLESGLRKPGGLQGDLEYIPFVRDAPERAFTKLLEMIKCLRPKALDAGGSQSTPPEPPDSKQQEERDLESKNADFEEPTNSWSHSDYSISLAKAIIKRNKGKETGIFNAYKAKLGKDADKCTEWEAEHLYYRYLFAKEDTLDSLKGLDLRLPTNGSIKTYIARIYMEYKQYGPASTYFTAAAGVALDSEARLRSLFDAAAAFAKDGNSAGIEQSLSEARQTATGVLGAPEIMLRYMADLTKTTEETELYLASSEALLEMNPADHDRRFDLAYKYSELGENDLSLFHYRILAAQRPSERVWNNIGVAAGELGMPIRSVQAYRESEKLKGTLALSNLAHKLLDVGFLEEADRTCQKALAEPNYDKQVGTALTQIREAPKKEEETEKGLLDRTSKRRDFFVHFGLACTKPSMLDCEGTWRSSEGDFHVAIKAGILTACGQVEDRQVSSVLASILAGQAVPSPKRMVTVRYEGRLHGMAVVYSRWEEDRKTESKITGVMYFSDDLGTLHIYQKGTRSSEKFSKMVRVSEPK